MKNLVRNLSDFLKYFREFYNHEDGIYPMPFEFNEIDITTAIANYSFRKPEHEFEGDSIDRELIKVEMMFLKGILNEDDTYYKSPLS